MPTPGATDALKILVLSGTLDPGDFLEATTTSVETRREASPIRAELIKITRVMLCHCFLERCSKVAKMPLYPLLLKAQVVCLSGL